MLKRILKSAGIMSQEERDDKLYNDLIKHEARIGGKLFGPVPEGTKREFFSLDENTWIFHEEIKLGKGQTKTRTIRYEVRPDSVVKVTNGRYQYLSRAEAFRFFDAVYAYFDRVKREIYSTI